MKIIAALLLPILGMQFGLCNSANATPITYDFQLPEWVDQDKDLTYFGSSGTLTVTFENRSPSNASQRYLSSEIQALTLTAVNGNFSHTWLSSGFRQGMDLSFFSTDSSGIATLYLPVVPGPLTGVQPASMWTDYNDGGQSSFQLGVMTTYGGSTPISVNKANPWPNFVRPEDVVFHYAVIYSPTSQGYFAPFSVIGAPRSDVPEPVTFTLFGAGFAAFVIARKRNARM